MYLIRTVKMLTVLGLTLQSVKLFHNITLSHSSGLRWINDFFKCPLTSMEISMKAPQKTKNRTTICSCYIAPGHIPKRIKVSIQERYLHTMFTATLFTIAKLWSQPSTQQRMNGKRTYGRYTISND
jgi:hypothetical protein